MDELLSLDIASANLGIVSGHEPRWHTVTQGKQHLALVPGFVDVAFTDTVAPNHFFVDGFLIGFQLGCELLNESPSVAISAKPARIGFLRNGERDRPLAEVFPKVLAAFPRVDRQDIFAAAGVGDVFQETVHAFSSSTWPCR